MRFPLAILATVVAAFALGFYLAVPANPEVKFWHQVVERRQHEIAAVRENRPGVPIIFFTGGSSCAFSIDPKIIENACGLPAFNLGLPVASGGEYLIHQALQQARAGDLLVLCLEPDMLVYPTDEGSPTKFSFAMAAAQGRIAEAAGGATFDAYPSLRDCLNYSRPGAVHMATLAAKLAAGKGYRYTIDDIRYHGRIETPVGGASPTGPRYGTCLTPDGRKLLETAARAASAKGVRTIYSFPWHHVTEDAVSKTREERLKLLAAIRNIMPAIDDGHLGAASNPAWFADSPLHLTAEGSSIRSQALASALHDWLRQQGFHSR